MRVLVALVLLGGCQRLHARQWDEDLGCWEDHDCVLVPPRGCGDLMTCATDRRGNRYIFTSTCICPGLDTASWEACAEDTDVPDCDDLEEAD